MFKELAAFLTIAEGVLVGFIGRPILWFIKWMGPMWLIVGLFFNEIAVYDPTSKKYVSTQHSFIPLIIGLILFSIGRTIKSYDEMQKSSRLK